MNAKLQHPVVRAVYEYLASCGAIEHDAENAEVKDAEVCVAVCETVIVSRAMAEWRASFSSVSHPAPGEPGRERMLGERIVALEAAVRAAIEALGPVPERDPSRPETARERLLWQLGSALAGPGGVSTRAT